VVTLPFVWLQIPMVGGWLTIGPAVIVCSWALVVYICVRMVLQLIGKRRERWPN
jgi:hypothetical protein